MQTDENAELPLCLCGCGEQVAKASNQWVFGHHRRTQSMEGEPPLCACGCGERTACPMSRYVRGHSSRRYCACGCGQVAPRYHRYVLNHHKRDTRDLAMCACGCGERVLKPGNTWIKGHSTRVRFQNRPDIESYPYCACGCGKRVAKIGNQWLLGHQMRAFSFAGPTEHEGMVQRALYERGRPFLFNLGLYGACRPDFQFPDAMLIIEVDGRGHKMAKQHQEDEEKDRFLASKGWLVLRWSNREVECSLPQAIADFERLYAVRLLSCQGSKEP